LPIIADGGEGLDCALGRLMDAWDATCMVDEAYNNQSV